MLRLLHMGDLHLGSRFSMFLSHEAAARRERQFVALEEMLTRGIEEKGANVVLFAGDCFDSTEPDPNIAARFFAILEGLSVPVVIAPGNHDYYREGGFWDCQPLPANVHLFRGQEMGMFDFPQLKLAVYGYAFTDPTMGSPVLRRSGELEPGRVCVLLAHGDLLQPLSDSAPISAGQLEASGFYYAALGHIHKPMEPRRYGNTVAAYSGFFTGRGFDELGAGQAQLVEISGKRVKVTTLESTADRFEERELDCTGITSGEKIRQRVAAFLKAEQYPRGTCLRLILTGNVGVACKIDRAAVVRLGERLAFFELIDRTVPIFDAEYLEKDPTINGAFYRAMLARLQSEDEETRRIAVEALRLGFAALSGREV